MMAGNSRCCSRKWDCTRVLPSWFSFLFYTIFINYCGVFVWCALVCFVPNHLLHTNLNSTKQKCYWLYQSAFALLASGTLIEAAYISYKYEANYCPGCVLSFQQIFVFSQIILLSFNPSNLLYFFPPETYFCLPKCNRNNNRRQLLCTLTVVSFILCLLNGFSRSTQILKWVYWWWYLASVNWLLVIRG